MLLFQRMIELPNNCHRMSLPYFPHFHIYKCKSENFLVSKKNGAKWKIHKTFLSCFEKIPRLIPTKKPDNFLLSEVIFS